MKSSDSTRPCSTSRQEKSQSPLCVPDIPLPTPPPMANIMMTSRFDLQTRGGCGYRRILSSRSTEFRSPLLGRSSLAQNVESYRSPLMPSRRFGSVMEELALSPMPRRRNFEDISARVEDFDDFFSINRLSKYKAESLDQFQKRDAETNTSRSKYLSRDSVLSQELEEVKNLNQEIKKKFQSDSQTKSTEVSPEYQNVFYNDHYISDIDENEEIKQFICGYNTPERRHSDHSEKSCAPNPQAFNNYYTLPSLSTFKCIKSASTAPQYGHISRTFGSNSSMKSSDYYLYCPLNIKKSDGNGNESSQKILKSPQRPVIKIAKIRLVIFIKVFGIYLFVHFSSIYYVRTIEIHINV